MDSRIRQSVCGVCGVTVGYGKGTVISYGAGGRVHTVKCLPIAQEVILLDRKPQDAARGHLEAA